MKPTLKRLLYLFTGLSLMLTFLGIQPAYAAGITVNSSADNTTPSDGFCTLREAITNANTNSDSTGGDCTAGSGADAITFAAGYTITSITEMPIVTTSITITGNGAANTIIQVVGASQTGTVRIFNIANTGALTLQNLSVANGGCGGSCITDGVNGGGILNRGTLNITNSTISGHRANSGGGIRNEGTLTVTNSSLSDNHANAGTGGAISNIGITTIVGSTFTGNYANFGGSALYNENGGTATVVNSTFTGNSATDSTIGSSAVSLSTTITITNSTISGNSALNAIFVSGSNVTLNISNTIVSGNIGGPDCFNNGSTIGISTSNLIQTNGAGLNACGTPTVTADPQLDVLGNNGGSTQTMALLIGSPAIDAGDDTICAAAQVNNTSQNGVTRPQGSHCDIGAVEMGVTFTSNATNDGYVLESTETSGVGGTMNSSTATINVGDDKANKQYRGILSFDTSSLPDTAVITSVTLKFRYASKTGTLPFSTHGNLMVDVRKGSFSNNAILQTLDFNATASKNSVLAFNSSMISNWFSKSLNPVNFQYINLAGPTQFRLRFSKDDNNDFGTDLLKIYSGNTATAANRPQLIIEYSIP